MIKKETKTKKCSPTLSMYKCSVYGIKWEKEATESVLWVAKGLFNLSELFKSQNIKIDTMIQVGGELNAEKKTESER